MQVIKTMAKKSLLVFISLMVVIQLTGCATTASVSASKPAEVVEEEKASYKISMPDLKVSGQNEIVFEYDAKYYSYKNDVINLNFIAVDSANYKKLTLTTNLNSDVVCSEYNESGLNSRAYSYDINVKENNSKLTVSVKFEDPVDSEKETAVSVIDFNVGLKPVSNEARMNFVYDLAVGWNLGNALDAHSSGHSSETAWGNPPASQKLFDSVAAAGFKVVRIPVTWLGHVGAAPEYKIDKGWMKRVTEVANYAHNAGLKAIINLHHDGADSTNWLNIKEGSASEAKNQVIEARLTKMWGQIAENFEGTADWLIFETMNEIHDGSWGWGANRDDGGKQYKTLNGWNQVCVNAIRSAGAANYISVPGYVTNPELTMKSLVIPKDNLNRIVVTVHNYDPNDFCLEAKTHEWGKNGTKVSSWGQESYLENLFFKLSAKYTSENIPVIIGECGATYQRGYESFRNDYMDFFVRTAHKYKLVPVVWDNGGKSSGKECSGLFDRSSGEVLSHTKDLVKIIVDAAK